MRRGMRWCWTLGVVVGLGLTLVPAALAHRHATVRHVSVVRGVLRPVSPRAARAARAVRQRALTAAPAPAAVLTRGARPIPRTSSAAAPKLAAVPQSPAQVLSPGSPLMADFNGVSSLDSEVTNYGAEFEPPDQGLCVGNGYVVEMVNSAYTVYRPNGTVVTGPFNVNGPFDEGLREFTSDPRCVYDAATNTWYASILYINAASTASRIDLAVNASGDPTKLWTDYQIDTTAMGGATGPKDPGCPCFGDQPTLGIDNTNIYITTNEFSILGPQFNGAQIYAIDKKELVDQSSPTATPVHFVHFRNLTIGGATAASVQPALTTGAASAEYFLNALDPNGTFDQRVGVWAMTNRAAVGAGGTPTLSSTILPSEAYGVPPGSDQRGSTSLINSGDDRMQQTQFIAGDVWGELGTSVTIPGDSAARAGAAWFDVRPTLRKGVLSTVRMARQGYVVSAGNDVIYPALQAAPSGKVVMGMTFTGTDHYPSTAYSVLPAGGTTFGPITISAAGTGSYDPTATRWGDYAWAALDPSGKSVWLANEYIPPKASQTTDGLRNWGTRVVDVPAG